MKLESEIFSAKPKRVICGNKNISWDEYSIAEGSFIHSFFEKGLIIETIVKLYPKIKEHSSYHYCWASCYKKGEHINSHTDRTGDLQVLICIDNKATVVGEGELFIKTDKSYSNIRLDRGDVVFFKASKVEHYSTPIVTLNEQNDSTYLRTILVARYFWNNK